MISLVPETLSSFSLCTQSLSVMPALNQGSSSCCWRKLGFVEMPGSSQKWIWAAEGLSIQQVSTKLVVMLWKVAGNKRKFEVERDCREWLLGDSELLPGEILNWIEPNKNRTTRQTIQQRKGAALPSQAQCLMFVQVEVDWAETPGEEARSHTNTELLLTLD